MTPLVTVTPRLEQEFRFDAYDQQNGTGSQGNGQHFVNYGGPGGARIEFIPAYNWEVIVAPPPYVTASGPKGSGEGWGDWPAFLVKYRLASANAQNGDYIVTAFFQMSDPLGTPQFQTTCWSSADLGVRQRLGRFRYSDDVQPAISGSPAHFARNHPRREHGKLRRSDAWKTAFQYHFMEYFGRNSRSITNTGRTAAIKVSARSCSRRASYWPLQDRHGQPDAADKPDLRRRLSDRGDTEFGHQQQLSPTARITF